MVTKAVFGLGNPGDRYQLTRHNIGARAVEVYVNRLPHPPVAVEDGFSKVYRVGNHLCVLPQTYMNLSGGAVDDIVRHHRLPLASCLIVYDDADLPLGQLRLRERGGHGGQRGMASVIEHLQTNEISRLRVGIHSDERGSELKDFVLSPFSTEQQPSLTEVLARAADAIECFLNRGMQTAMNRYNGPAT